jgi:excisionase family DNA binding protein
LPNHVPAPSSLVATVSETAQLLRISEASVRSAIRRKQLYAVMVGRRLLIPRAAVDKLLEVPSLSA